MWKRVMDGVRGRVARFRAPGAALSPIIPVADESRPVERPAPESATILWQPMASAASGAVSSFIYISQRALAAVQDHCATEYGACSGLLTGELYRSPDTEEPYVVVESTIRLPPTPGGGGGTTPRRRSCRGGSWRRACCGPRASSSSAGTVARGRWRMATGTSRCP